jgi:hypothetical protein
MSKDSFEALQRDYASLSRKVDECWLQYGRTRSPLPDDLGKSFAAKGQLWAALVLEAGSVVSR